MKNQGVGGNKNPADGGQSRSRAGDRGLARSFLSDILCTELFKALSADFLTLEICNVLDSVAEHAGRLILRQDYLLSVDEYLNGVVIRDAHVGTDLLRYYYSSELIHISYYAC